MQSEMPESLPVITPATCRAGRALLSWTIRDLAGAAGVNVTTVARYEVSGRARPDTLRKLKAALETHGVELVASARVAGALRVEPHR